MIRKNKWFIWAVRASKDSIWTVGQTAECWISKWAFCINKRVVLWVLLFLFLANVHMDVHAQKRACSHMYLQWEVEERMEARVSRSLFLHPHSRAHTAVLMQRLHCYRFTFCGCSLMERWATKCFSEQVNFLDNSAVLTGILNS